MLRGVPDDMRAALGEANLTLRLERAVVLWARLRAYQRRTTLNQEVRQYLEQYADIPRWWLDGKPEPRPDED